MSSGAAEGFQRPVDGITLQPGRRRPLCRPAAPVARQVAGRRRHLLSGAAVGCSGSAAAAVAAAAEVGSRAMAMLVEGYTGKRLRPDDAVGQPVSTALYTGYGQVRWNVPLARTPRC